MLVWDNYLSTRLPAIDVDNWPLHVNERVAKLTLEQLQNVRGICGEGNASDVIRVGGG